MVVSVTLWVLSTIKYTYCNRYLQILNKNGLNPLLSIHICLKIKNIMAKKRFSFSFEPNVIFNLRPVHMNVTICTYI